MRIANGRGNLLVWKLAVLGPACSGKTELLNALRDDPFVENEPGKEVDRVPRIVVDSLEIGGVPLGVLGVCVCVLLFSFMCHLLSVSTLRPPHVLVNTD